MKLLVLMFILCFSGCAKLSDGLGGIAARTSMALSTTAERACSKNKPTKYCEMIAVCLANDLLNSYDKSYPIRSGRVPRETIVNLVFDKKYKGLSDLSQHLTAIQQSENETTRVRLEAKKFQLSIRNCERENTK